LPPRSRCWRLWRSTLTGHRVASCKRRMTSLSVRHWVWLSRLQEHCNSVNIFAMSTRTRIGKPWMPLQASEI
jgi:hypothetical protein